MRWLFWIAVLGWTVPCAITVWLGLNYIGYLESRIGGSGVLHSFPYRSALTWSAWSAMGWLALAIGIVAGRLLVDPA